MYGGRIGACVKELVLLPSTSYEMSHTIEVHTLYGVEHIECVLLHVAQHSKLVVLVEEHTTYNLGKDGLGGACDACVVEQVASLVVRLCEERVRQITHFGCLCKTTVGLKQFYAR